MTKLHGMRTSRALASVAMGAAVGLTVASLVGIPQLVGPWSVPALLSNAFGFWGLVLGGFAAVTAAGISFAFLSKRDLRASRWGRIIAGLTLGVFAAGTMTLGPAAMWGWPSPFTLEGLWFYPLVFASTVGAVYLLRRRRPGFCDNSPGS